MTSIVVQFTLTLTVNQLNCTADNVMWLGNYLKSNIILYYIHIYVGSFKTRWQGHKTSFKHERYKTSTKLSLYIWSLKEKNVPYSIKWSIIGRASTYNPATKKCRLCLLEKFFILYHPAKSKLNSRSELFSKCLHKAKNLLYNQ